MALDCPHNVLDNKAQHNRQLGANLGIAVRFGMWSTRLGLCPHDSLGYRRRRRGSAPDRAGTSRRCGRMWGPS